MATTELFLKMTFDRWNGSITNCDAILNSLTDETLQKEVAPGKNRGIYLLGHLIAAHDDMLVLLDMGQKLYPELHEPFLKSADKTTTLTHTLTQLRAYWTKQSAVLNQKFAALKPEEWFEKHTAVSAEDF